MFEPIKVEGLAAYARSLRKLDAEAPKGLRLALNAAADVVVVNTAKKFPRRSGRAASTIKARSTRTTVRIGMGGRRAPYVPWLDWGGRVGRGRSVERAFVKTGRYLYPTFHARHGEVRDVLERGLADTVRRAGLDVD